MKKDMFSFSNRILYSIEYISIWYFIITWSKI